MFGGVGPDTFLYASIGDSTVNPAGRDRIRDFNEAEGDVIDLQRIDADVNTAGDQAFDFIGFANFSGTAGELRMQANDAHLLLTADVNGDGIADFALLLRDVAMLTDAAFVL
jgi:Ca2+-binding RTX toxin-like protein